MLRVRIHCAGPGISEIAYHHFCRGKRKQERSGYWWLMRRMTQAEIDAYVKEWHERHGDADIEWPEPTDDDFVSLLNAQGRRYGFRGDQALNACADLEYARPYLLGVGPYTRLEFEVTQPGDVSLPAPSLHHLMPLLQEPQGPSIKGWCLRWTIRDQGLEPFESVQRLLEVREDYVTGHKRVVEIERRLWMLAAYDDELHRFWRSWEYFHPRKLDDPCWVRWAAARNITLTPSLRDLPDWYAKRILDIGGVGDAERRRLKGTLELHPRLFADGNVYEPLD